MPSCHKGTLREWGCRENKIFFSVLSLKEIGQFQKIVGGLIELVDQLAKEAENEKMKVRSACLPNLGPFTLPLPS